MTDRELLEKAAKAAGLRVRWHSNGHYGPTMEIMDDESGGPPWNPLTDDGDALRLAVKLEIQVHYSDFSGNAYVRWDRGSKTDAVYGPECPDQATRRAIVRAAAALAGD